MGIKRQVPIIVNWQSTVPYTQGSLLNAHNAVYGTTPSGTVQGAMASTNTIYSQIIERSQYDSSSIEVNYNYGGGNATGTISILASNSGMYFYPLTFDPALSQPAGSSGGYVIFLSPFEIKYYFLQYVNASGSGNLSCYILQTDYN